MKVKELIEKLKELDPEKNIWVIYDYGCNVFPPIPEGIANEEDCDFYQREEIKEGDYLIYAD